MKLNTVKVTFEDKNFTFSDDYRYLKLADVVHGIPSGDFIYSLAKACTLVTKDEIAVIAMDESGQENKYINYDNLCKYVVKAQEGMPRTTKSSTTTAFRGIQALYDKVAETKIPTGTEIAELSEVYKALAKVEEKLKKQAKVQTLLKEIKELKDQLALSEAKNIELRDANLRIINERDLLKGKVTQLESFRNKILEATGKTLTA